MLAQIDIRCCGEEQFSCSKEEGALNNHAG